MHECEIPFLIGRPGHHTENMPFRLIPEGCAVVSRLPPSVLRLHSLEKHRLQALVQVGCILRASQSPLACI